MSEALPDKVSVDLDPIIGNVSDFLERLHHKVSEIGIDISALEIDHICYRSSSLSQYQEVKHKLLQIDGVSILVETMIGGRPITIFELATPITFAPWNIRCIELASPKMGRLHHAGLEHAEVVIGTEKEDMLNSRALLEKFATEHPDVSFDRKAISKDLNADIMVDLGEGQAIKFHARPLYEVCAYEVANGLVEQVPPGYFDV